MLNQIKNVSNSPLRIFLSTSYSLEILLVLAEVDTYQGLENLYNSLSSPKPKQPSFDVFIKRLLSEGWIVIEVGKDKRTKVISLSDKAWEVLQNLKIEFHSADNESSSR
jgi:DNA-binding PadR family transcriptional regulator